MNIMQELTGLSFSFHLLGLKGYVSDAILIAADAISTLSG